MVSISKFHLVFLLSVFSIWPIIYIGIYLPIFGGEQQRQTVVRNYNGSFEVIDYSETNVQRIAASNKMFRFLIKKEAGFLNLLREEGVVPILIEPRLLIHLLTDEERTLLIKKNIPITEYSKHDTITTYGLFESDSKNFTDSTTERMVANGYKYGKTESSDARHFHWNYQKNKNTTITGHHFFVKSQHVYHLVILYKRGNFLWSSEISSPPPIASHVNVENITIGRYASGFEMFQTVTIQIGELVIQIPFDIKWFLFEIPTSRFMECNFSVARKFYVDYWNTSKPSESFDSRTRNVIKEVKALVKPLLIPFWICSGTLLGWYRQCDVIPYTTDIDLAAWSTDISEALEERAKRNPNKLRLKFVYGIPSESYQYALYYHGLRVDFFFTYKEENNYYYGGHIPSTATYFHYVYPKFTLCSADLLGNKVLVPCNSEQVIAAEYGNNWTVPVSSWRYDNSAYNIGPKLKWPRDLVKQVFKTF